MFFTQATRLFLLLALLAPVYSASAATTVRTKCSDTGLSCDTIDLTKASQCRDALNDAGVKKNINSSVCCTGGSGAQTFKLPDAPTPPKEDKVCTDFSLSLSGKGNNKEVVCKIDKANCNGAACPTKPGEPDGGHSDLISVQTRDLE